MTDPRTSKDQSSCATHAAEHRNRDTLPCPWCVIDELKRSRDSLRRETEQLRTNIGELIGEKIELSQALQSAHEPPAARFPRDNAGPDGWTIQCAFLKQVLSAADAQPEPWDLSLEQVEAVLLALETVSGAAPPPGELHAEVERMRKLFWLAKEDVIFFSGYDQRTDSWPVIDLFYAPCVTVNDTFEYACADAERLDDSEIDRLIDAHKRWGYDGVVAWASLIRKCEPIEPRRTVPYYAARSALTKPADEVKP